MSITIRKPSFTEVSMQTRMPARPAPRTTLDQTRIESLKKFGAGCIDRLKPSPNVVRLFGKIASDARTATVAAMPFLSTGFDGNMASGGLLTFGAGVAVGCVMSYQAYLLTSILSPDSPDNNIAPKQTSSANSNSLTQNTDPRIYILELVRLNNNELHDFLLNSDLQYYYLWKALNALLKDALTNSITSDSSKNLLKQFLADSSKLECGVAKNVVLKAISYIKVDRHEEEKILLINNLLIEANLPRAMLLTGSLYIRDEDLYSLLDRLNMDFHGFGLELLNNLKIESNILDYNGEYASLLTCLLKSEALQDILYSKIDETFFLIEKMFLAISYLGTDAPDKLQLLEAMFEKMFPELTATDPRLEVLKESLIERLQYLTRPREKHALGVATRIIGEISKAQEQV
jgi:hypothetical protein